MAFSYSASIPHHTQRFFEDTKLCQIQGLDTPFSEDSFCVVCGAAAANSINPRCGRALLFLPFQHSEKCTAERVPDERFLSLDLQANTDVRLISSDVKQGEAFS